MPALTSFVAWIVLGFFAQTATAPSLSDRVTDTMRNRIEAADQPVQTTLGEEPIYASRFLPLFYQERFYQAAWSNDGGPAPHVAQLVQALDQAVDHGLDPSAYHTISIERIWSEVQRNARSGIPLDPRRLVDLDLLLTDAFLIYASHLVSGRVHPETFDSEWHVVVSKDVDFTRLLENAVSTGRISEALKSLLPDHHGYTALQKALSRYRTLAREGGWVPVPDAPKLQLDDREERVALLRQRLYATGDLEEVPPESSDRFDVVLEGAVKAFQRRHGLEFDGVVGSATLAALNVSAEERVRQLELNLERWRWLPKDLGERYILVNIPGFELEVVEGGNTVLEMRVVVGKPYRRTPVFSAHMTYLVFSPFWHVPPSLAVQDVLPAVQKDSEYLTKKKFKVFRGWGAETKEIDPAAVDWSTLSGRNFPFRFRQEPGAENALGAVKFMFPNPFNVYLHDTPSRELFRRADRTFSSGCIRIEEPLELAEYVLGGAGDWGSEAILAASRQGVEQTVRLPQSIPVHLLYWTSWVDAEGIVHFRNDVYGRDRLLDEALREKPPTDQ